MIAAAAAVALTLSAPQPAPARPPAAPVVCTKYRVQAEKNDLVPEGELAGWASAALEKAGLLDRSSPCYLHLRVTAGPIRSGGREDGWVAHVAVSTRRYLKDGKLVMREKGMLLVEPRREALASRVRAFVEEYVPKLKAPAADEAQPAASDRG